MLKYKLKDPPRLPQLSGVKLLGRICLHPTKSSRCKFTKRNLFDEEDEFTEVSAQPPSLERIKDETSGRRAHLDDRFSHFLLSHCGDRPWRREEGELPLWNPSAALSNKAAILTAKIASEFCEWYRGLGGSAIIDENTIQALFDIHLPEPARSATRVEIRKLENDEIPNHILDAARKNQGVQFSPPSRPKFEVDPVKVAFGRCVPVTKRSSRPPCRVPPLPQPPEGLFAMDTVFSGIKHLRVTRGFCEVLEESPTSQRPECLVKVGLLPEVPVKMKTLTRPRRRVSSNNPSIITF